MSIEVENSWKFTLENDVFHAGKSCHNITWSAVSTSGQTFFSIPLNWFDWIALQVDSMHGNVSVGFCVEAKIKEMSPCVLVLKQK